MAVLSPALKNIAPDELAQAAARDLAAFLTLYGDTLLLLVRLRPGDTELAAGLGATALRAQAGMPVKPVIGSMSFRTEMETTPADIGKARSLFRQPEIIEQLQKDRHYGVALRKRKSAEALYPDRIALGRAPNKDIVLRHSSVSKFHAWFEVDEAGIFYVADADSKNRTRINGTAVPPHEPTLIEPGDLLSFGSVEGLLCSARGLWETLSRGAKRGSLPPNR